MDLAAAAGARATRMSLLWAGWSSWRTRAGATPRYRDGTDDYATAGSGPTRQSGSTGLGVQYKSTRRGMRWVFIILTSCSFFLGKPSQTGLGAKLDLN